MRIDVEPFLPSTQDELLSRIAADGTHWPHLSALRAERQGAGRGRSGRKWDTSTLRALTISYVLRPVAPVQQWGGLALRGGVAVIRALAVHNVDALLKWPNDVVVTTPGGAPGWEGIKKVAGVLGTIAKDSAGEQVCVLGIGVNLEGEVPLPSAGALATPLSAQTLAEDISRELALLVPGGANARVGGGAAVGPRADAVVESISDLMEQYCHTLGKRVEVSFPREQVPRRIEGQAVGVDEHGSLIVQTPHGKEVVTSGDISHTRLQPPVG